MSLCLLYEPQKSAALVNKRPAYQWRGEGGAGTAFKETSQGRGEESSLQTEGRSETPITDGNDQRGSSPKTVAAAAQIHK